MTTPARHLVLLVEDEEGIRASVTRFLQGRGYDVDEADSMAGAEERFRARRPDAVILDYYMPDGDGLALLKTLRAVDATVPVVLLTAHGSIDLAVRALKEGADHFLTKPTELPTLLVVIERLIENQRHRQASLAQKSRAARVAVDPFLGESPAMKRLAEQARRVLASSSPVLILGETGSGKGLLANWLHENGPRADEAFVDLNCAGLSRELLESEIFGHEKGAFTGAVASKPGLLEIAHRGSLFLDEIGDVESEVQAKLLKVLEEQRYRKLGDVRDRRVDVRFIAATHHDLERAVREGRFRQDLYYRISTLPLRVPPLRERGNEIVPLARVLASRIAQEQGRPGVTLSDEAERAILAYPWPGNVRELRSVLERAILHGSHVVSAAELSDGLTPGAPARAAGRTLRDIERAHIEVVLAEVGGQVEQAAKVLGLSRAALYQRIRKHGIALRKD